MSSIQLNANRTVTIPLVVPMDWIDRLNEAAQQSKVTRSALIREAIDTALFQRDTGDAPGRTLAVAKPGDQGT
jgi:hypothetical protein